MAGRTFGRGWKGLVCGVAAVCALSSDVRGEGVPLPYRVPVGGFAGAWTEEEGWSGTAEDSYADGSAKFTASGQELVLELDGVPTEVSFALTAHASTAPSEGEMRFVLEESVTGVDDWGTVLPLAGVGAADVASGAKVAFGPFRPDAVTRFLRFRYVNFAGYNLALSDVEVPGGPAGFKVLFPGRVDGFSVVQGAEGEVIEATVQNDEGAFFGADCFGNGCVQVPAWESDNGGSFSGARFTIDTSTAGAFQATANACGGDALEPGDEPLSGTIRFRVAPACTLTLQVASGAATGTAEAWIDGVRVLAGPGTATVPDGAEVQLAFSPAEGWRLGPGGLALNGGPCPEDRFALDGDATVAVTFTEDPDSGAGVFISQYYEGSGNNKWIELFNATGEDVDLAAGRYALGLWVNDARETWKDGAAPGKSIALEGTVPSGGTFLVAHPSAVLPAYATAAATNAALAFNGDDSVALYQGAVYSFGMVVDVIGVTGNVAKDVSLVRTSSVRGGASTDLDETAWRRVTCAEVDAAAPETPERLGWHAVAPTDPEPEELTVALSPSDPFPVTVGTATQVLAKASGAAGEVSWAWSCVPDCGGTADGATYAIPATAAPGGYVLTATADDGAADASASVAFSVVEPPPEPRTADYVFDFEAAWTGSGGYAASECLHETNGIGMAWSFTNALRGADAADRKEGAAAGRIRSGGAMESSTAFPRAIEAMALSLAEYGNDSGVGLLVSMASADGAWAPVWSNLPAAGAALASFEVTAAAIPADASRVRLEAYGAPNGRVNVDGLRFWLVDEGGGGDDPPAPFSLSNFAIEDGTAGRAVAFDVPAAVAAFRVFEASALTADDPPAWAGAALEEGVYAVAAGGMARRVTIPVASNVFGVRVYWVEAAGDGEEER